MKREWVALNDSERAMEKQDTCSTQVLLLGLPQHQDVIAVMKSKLLYTLLMTVILDDYMGECKSYTEPQ